MKKITKLGLPVLTTAFAIGINHAGASYPEAKLKLIAGDVKRARPPGQITPAALMSKQLMRAEERDSFAEKTFFEYHLYTLGRPTTLPDNSLEFIGEDVIDHTPRNEKAQITLGSAFDVVGERRQTDFKVDTSRKMMSEDIEVKLRNQKKEPVTVIIKENLYRWVNWQITTNTHNFDKQDSRTIHFPVKIAAGAEVTVRYSVRYTW